MGYRPLPIGGFGPMARPAGDAASVPDRTVWVFLIAGVLATVFGVNTYLATFTGTFYEAIQGFVGPLGFFLAVLGLLTLYPRLADRTPLAHLAAAVAGVTLLAWLVILGGGVGELVGLFSEQPEVVLMISMVAIFGMLLSFAITGLLVVWVGYPSRLAGGLMLLESAMFLALVARLLPAYAIDTGHVLALLGIALTLRYGSVAPDRTDSTAESMP